MANGNTFREDVRLLRNLLSADSSYVETVPEGEQTKTAAAMVGWVLVLVVMVHASEL